MPLDAPPRRLDDPPKRQGKRDFVSKSSQERASNRAVVIQSGGELSEFVDLLRDLAVPVDTREARTMPHPDDLEETSVVVVSGRRLVETSTPNLSLWPRTIAVVDDSSRTLISHLNRLGASLIIRRPIHRRTLRLLLLHEIYRGPERRNRRRTLIGHPIKTGSGLFKHDATLLELSPTGARIEVPGIPKVGSMLKLLLGKELTLGKPLKLDVKVIRCLRPSGKSDRKGAEIGVALLDPRRDAQAIKALLDRFAKGPAPWKGKQTARPAAPPVPAATQVTPVETKVEAAPPRKLNVEETGETTNSASPMRRLPPSHVIRHEARPRQATDHSVGSAGDPADTTHAKRDDQSRSERRQAPRVPYDQRVVALDEEAARVIVGRELSQGGMRVESSNGISVGDTLRLALHCGTAHQPLIVLAQATREDEDGSTVLSFVRLSESQRDAMERIIETACPIHAQVEHESDEAVGAASIVVGEMLEKVESEAPRGSSVFDAGEAVENPR